MVAGFFYCCFDASFYTCFDHLPSYFSVNFMHVQPNQTRKNERLVTVQSYKPFNNWCRRRDSNSHDRGPLPPQDSVSTNSTTSA